MSTVYVNRKRSRRWPHKLDQGWVIFNISFLREMKRKVKLNPGNPNDESNSWYSQQQLGTCVCVNVFFVFILSRSLITCSWIPDHVFLHNTHTNGGKNRELPGVWNKSKEKLRVFRAHCTYILYIYTCGYRVKGERKTWATSGAALLLKGIEPGANCEEVVVLVELGC